MRIGAGSNPTLHDQLTALAKDITYTTAALFPTQATALGIPGHDGELDTPSEANRAAYIARLQQWQKQLEQLGLHCEADRSTPRSLIAMTLYCCAHNSFPA